MKLIIALVTLTLLPLTNFAQIDGISKNTFLNPILSGDFPDPSIMRDGKDYYMTHSSMNYLPGLLVLHSTDLVNWKPISNALTKFLGSVWAPDIFKYEGKYYIYFTVAGKGNFAVHSASASGPMSFS